jgi:hypothetical protein
MLFQCFHYHLVGSRLNDWHVIRRNQRTQFQRGGAYHSLQSSRLSPFRSIRLQILDMTTEVELELTNIP